MQNIEINHKLLERVADINLFILPQNTDYVLFGIRGGLPTEPANYTFKSNQVIRKAKVNIPNQIVDYKTFCCTIGIWNRKAETVAIFPASTVPHGDNLAKAVQTNRFDSCNQLFTGYYPYFKEIHQGESFYVKGLRHYKSKDKGRIIVCRRLSSSSIHTFESGEDTVSTTVGDNFHPAYTYFNGGDGTITASHGCQIIAGYPDPLTITPNRNGEILKMRWTEKETWKIAAWNDFQKKIYSLPQEDFNYMLLTWHDYVQATSSKPIIATPRYGSSDKFIAKLKTALKIHSETNNLQNDTFTALWKWQKEKLKIENPSDFLTEDLAQELGIILPKI
jgi:hypothetical protein